MTRKLPMLSLFAAGLLALLLFLAQSDTVRADTPTAVTPQAEAATEDTLVALTLTADHVDGIASPSCENLTFALTGLPSDGTLSVGGTDITATGTVPTAADNACTAGTLAADADTDTATVDYTPNAEFNGADSFTYTVAHGAAVTGNVTVNITVAAVDDAPVAADQTVTTPVNTDVDVTLNATDIDDCDLTFGTSTLVNGTVTTPTVVACTLADPQTDATPNSDSATVTFTPTTGFQGTGSFTFSADATNTTVTVTIGSTPVADAQSVTTGVNTDVVIILTGSDADGCDTFTYTIPTITDLSGAFGTLSDTTPTVTCSGAGALSASVTFTPATADIQGTDTFTFTLDDGSTGGNSTSTAATVTITVGAAPVANAQTVTTAVNTSVVITLTGSDADTADCELTFAIVSGPTIGTLGPINDAACVSGTPNTDSATVTFVPNLDAQGSDSVTFSVDDGTFTPTTATVTITVAVAAVPGLTAVQADATADLTLTTSFQDVPGATLTLNTAGTYTITGNLHYRKFGSGDQGAFFNGRLLLNGVEQPGRVTVNMAVGEAILETRTWVVTVSAGDVVKLQARKHIGTGSSKVRGPAGAGTSIIALGPF